MKNSRMASRPRETFSDTPRRTASSGMTGPRLIALPSLRSQIRSPTGGGTRTAGPKKPPSGTAST